MPLIPFPNVPAVPGVPNIPRTPAVNTAARVSLGVLQGTLWRAVQTASQWGIYDSDGNPLGDPSVFGGVIGSLLDSVGIGNTLSTGVVDYSKETRVSDFPVERGFFASYNKVELAANPTVTLLLGGTEKGRTTFLSAIDSACKSTELYSVVTPEVTYINYAIERYSYRRSNSSGATLLAVDVTLREVREVSAQYAQTTSGQIGTPTSPTASPQVNGGKVQGQAPKQSTLKSIFSKFGF